MGKQPKSEEALKDDIFNDYSEYISEPSHDRRGVIFARFHKSIIEWCYGYLYNKVVNAELQIREANLFYVEIYEALERLVKNEVTVPKEKNNFFAYLRTTLDNAKNEYYRDCEGGPIHIPKGKIELLNKINTFIDMKKQNSERELSENEIISDASFFLGIPEDKVRTCMELMNKKNVLSFDIFELKKASVSPDTQYDTQENIKDALKKVFQGKYAKQPFYKSLFTGLCLDTLTEPTHYEWFSEHFEYLKEFLDEEMLEEYKKTGKRPKDLEICLKHYPGINNPSQSASNRKEPFLEAFRTACKEKNVEYFFSKTP
jgi:hypothetical protein